MSNQGQQTNPSVEAGRVFQKTPPTPGRLGSTTEPTNHSSREMTAGNMVSGPETGRRGHICPVCGKENLAPGLFCGGCGYYLGEAQLDWFSPPAPVSVRPGAAGKTAGPGGLPPLSESEPSVPDETSDFLASSQSKVMKRWLKNTWKTKGWLMGLITLVIFGLSPILALQSLSWNETRPMSLEKVAWGDLRTILSRRLALTLTEVDTLAQKAFHDVPADGDTIDCRQARILKEYVNSLGSNAMPVFNWLPSQGPLYKTYLVGFADSQEMTLFPDVAIGHPLYRAWKTLLHWRIPLSFAEVGVEKIFAAPFEPLRWEDWNLAIAKILELIGKSPHLIPVAQRKKTGGMNRGEFFQSLRQMAQLMEVAGEVAESGESRKPFVSRFEGYSVLSFLLERKEEQP